MEHQPEGLGLRPPDAAEETAGEMADNMAGVTTEDTAGELASEGAKETAGYRAEEAEANAFGELPDGTYERRPTTGEPRVDAALARLDELEALPVTEHRAVFEDVHQRLTDVLGELDTGRQREAGHAPGLASWPGR
ncbi:MAG TPA: hypothetical protein VH307_06320 [Streptosporangiaceae bacterium]|jgi:hypothetical protein|nr:hypothetical protein [Streptosporangiaceae bacterium]